MIKLRGIAGIVVSLALAMAVGLYSTTAMTDPGHNERQGSGQGQGTGHCIDTGTPMDQGTAMGSCMSMGARKDDGVGSGSHMGQGMGMEPGMGSGAHMVPGRGDHRGPAPHGRGRRPSARDTR